MARFRRPIIGNFDDIKFLQPPGPRVNEDPGYIRFDMTLHMGPV